MKTQIISFFSGGYSLLGLKPAFGSFSQLEFPVAGAELVAAISYTYFINKGCNVYIITARCEGARHDTLKELKKHNITGFKKLIMFPGWLIPFSNTIGYFFCYVTGISKFFKSILKDRNTLNLDKNKAAIVQALDNVYEDSSMLINQITIPELPEWWKTMKEGGLLKAGVGNDQYNELSKYILLKNNISEFTWFVLTGGLVTSASYNYILNSGCQQSVSEMKKRHTEYVEKDKKISENAKKGGSKQMVYKGYE